MAGGIKVARLFPFTRTSVPNGMGCANSVKAATVKTGPKTGIPLILLTLKARP